MARNKKNGLEIRALHTQRKTVSEIAKKIHLSEEEVVKYLEEHCLKPIYEHEAPTPHCWASELEKKSPPPLIIADEINKVAELYNKGIPYREMSEMLGIAYNRLTHIVKKARKQGVIGKRMNSYPDKRKSKTPEPAKHEENEEFCCEVTPETDMKEYMKDREKYVTTKQLPDIVCDALFEKFTDLQNKIREEENLLNYYTQQLDILEKFIKENEICQK